MKRLLTTTVNTPLWLMLTLLAGVAIQNHSLYANAVETWRLKDLAHTNSRACDDYLNPSVRYNNLSDEQKSHYNKCFSKTTTTKGN